MSTYDGIKIQIARKTGTYHHLCIACGKSATARVSRIVGKNDLSVKTTCRHCHTSYSFVWKK